MRTFTNARLAESTLSWQHVEGGTWRRLLGQKRPQFAEKRTYPQVVQLLLEASAQIFGDLDGVRDLQYSSQHTVEGSGGVWNTYSGLGVYG